MVFLWRLYHVTFSLLYVIFEISLSFGSERELNGRVNPDCPTQLCNDTFVHLMHVKALGERDAIHYFWFFQNKPAVYLALTEHNATAKVHWNSTTISSIQFDSKPIYSFSVLINNIYEFNDVNDTGNLDNKNLSDSYIRSIGLPSQWKAEPPRQYRDFIQLTMIGTWDSSASPVLGGSLKVELEVFRKPDHSQYLPHLTHTTNTTQIDLAFRNITSKSGFNNTRFAVEFVLAAAENSSTSDLHIYKYKSFDDEYSPGIFTVMDLQTSASRSQGKGGFIHCRPVAYVGEQRDVVNSTDIVIYDVGTVNSDLNSTILNIFYGPNMDSNLLKAFNVSFGASDDGFYAKQKYTSWTATIGYGHPPKESLSMIVVLVIGIGLGVPAFVIVAGFIYLVIRRFSHQRDELFLNR